MLHYKNLHTKYIFAFFESEEKKNKHIRDDFKNMKLLKAIGMRYDEENSFTLKWDWNEEELCMTKVCIFKKDYITIHLEHDYTYYNSDTERYEGYVKTSEWDIYRGQSLRCMDEELSLEWQEYLKEIWNLCDELYFNNSEDS